MRIEVFSDTVCPWCFVGKRILEQVVADRPAIDFEIHWQSYLLHPYVPVGGMPMTDFMKRAFGRDTVSKGFVGRIQEWAEPCDIQFNFAAQKRFPNTIASHVLLHLVDDLVLRAQLKEDLLKAHFEQGLFIENSQVLCQLGECYGLTAQVVEQAIVDPVLKAQVVAQWTQARESGIMGVPHFRIAGEYDINGVHEYARMLKAIDHISSETVAV